MYQHLSASLAAEHRRDLLRAAEAYRLARAVRERPPEQLQAPRSTRSPRALRSALSAAMVWIRRRPRRGPVSARDDAGSVTAEPVACD
jgi:hypothetical protein